MVKSQMNQDTFETTYRIVKARVPIGPLRSALSGLAPCAVVHRHIVQAVIIQGDGNTALPVVETAAFLPHDELKDEKIEDVKISTYFIENLSGLDREIHGDEKTVTCT